VLSWYSLTGKLCKQILLLITFLTELLCRGMPRRMTLARSSRTGSENCGSAFPAIE
jgi:hypothetical protein